MKRQLWLAAALFAASLVPYAATAAVVNFTVADFDNVSQVSTTGTLVEAWNLGSASDGDDVASNAGAPGDVTINGVTFASDPGDGTGQFYVAAVRDDRRPNWLNPNQPTGEVTGLSDADGLAFFQPYERSSGNLGAVDNLMVGATYEIQLFLDRNCTTCISSAGYAENPGDPVTVPAATSSFSALEPVVVTGVFTADNAVQEIYFYEDVNNPVSTPNQVGDGLGIGELSGFQLRLVRPVPEPGSIVLIGVGLAAFAFVSKRK